MRTYSHSRIRDLLRLLRRNLFSTKEKAIKVYTHYRKIKKHVKSNLGEKLKGLRILDLGCGQRFPYTYLLSRDNTVVGIDLDVVLTEHKLSNYISIIKKNGINRFLKTFIRSIFFDMRYYQQLRKLESKGGKTHRFHLLRMNAEDLKLPDDSFDFVISIYAFEHIQHVEKVIKEIKRVLTPQGKFYIAVDFYTKLYGGHKPDPHHPWNHLLDENFTSDVYLNKLRLDDYITLFKTYFDDLSFLCQINEKANHLLTPELKKKLPQYSQKELIMEPLIVMGTNS